MPITSSSVRDEVSCTFILPSGAYYTVMFSGLSVIAAGGYDAVRAWFTRVQADITRLGEAIEQPASNYIQIIEASAATLRTAPTRDSFIQSMESHMHAAYATLERSLAQNMWVDEPGTLQAPPVPDPVPVEYLGYSVRRTPNVARGNITIQSGILYVNEVDAPAVWQPLARANIARRMQRSIPVSIKRTCRLCGKAYPARQGLAEPDAYCSDRCRTHATDLIDCPVCGGTGQGRNEGDKCGECFGTSYAPCAACQEDNARMSLGFLTANGAGVYHVCPSCVPDERAAGATPAPQMEV